jgi:biopolymer transport protein ExbB
LERRIGTIAALARIAPLLGFLGTIIAVLQALYQLDVLNSNSNAFSRLLAEALISSAFGIAIGILATLAHHFLFGRVRALVHDFEWAGHTLYELLTVGDTKDGVPNENEGEPK